MRSSDPVLIVSEAPDHRNELAAAVSSSGLMATHCGTLETAGFLLGEQEFSMMFCDQIPSDNMRAVIRDVSRRGPQLPIIVVSAQDDWDSYLGALRAGAFDCVVLPAAPGELARIVTTALRKSV
jgi:two-component system response regulator PilR (NtrC family)